MKKYGGRGIVHERDVHAVPQEQPNKGSVIMSGALNATTNQVSWLYSTAKDTQAMIDLIEILFNRYPFTIRIYLTWDAASWHKSGLLVEWLDAQSEARREKDLGDRFLSGHGEPELRKLS